MSPRNRRAVAMALAGALAVVPLGAQSASGASDPGTGTSPAAAVPPVVGPPDPAAGAGTGVTPPDGTPTTPAGPGGSTQAGDNAQCGQLSFTSTFPTVITCGPVTITFNTYTTTTTVTTVTAPITAANGAITTDTTNNAGTTSTTNAPATTTTNSTPTTTTNAATTTHSNAAGRQSCGKPVTTTRRTTKPKPKRRSNAATPKRIRVVIRRKAGQRSVKFLLVFTPRARS